MMMDIFSRKIVGCQVYEYESGEMSADLLTDACRRQRIHKGQLTLHSDNGSPIDEYAIYSRLDEWGYDHESVNHGAGEYARDDDGDGFCEVHVNTMEGLWSLLRSWIRPNRGISQEKFPLYLGFFKFVHNVGRRGKFLLHSLIEVMIK